MRIFELTVFETYFIKGDNNKNDIKQKYDLDKQNLKSRSLVKTTDAHIYPISFRKM